MGIRIDVDSQNNFADVEKLIGHLVVEGTNLAAHRLMALSVARAPLDVGTLTGSAQVTAAEALGDAAIVSYDTPYAARLHEHPEYNFQGGREGKYLENPALENQRELGEVIATRVRDGA